ncbi:hypothetical protein BD626DRAFT_156908 [Schizophyllum amplum]|uniref:DUF6535 domain-containing protein n=1 Tax=Schizophyllum amplum TaxID=97359 RepID=A0A550C325_9AGAR|nr:hypothetical protein BD626DRAFT_156908 [Auriculariopsis ampla]
MEYSTAKSSYIQRFLRLCTAPFRSTIPDLGKQLMGDVAYNPNAMGDPSFQDSRTQVPSSKDGYSSASGEPTASARTSMSREAAELSQDTKWRMGDGNFANKPQSEETAWQECYNLIDKHDTMMCQVFKEEVDTLMVFAGLFSGVLTAFIIESYKWLMEEPDDLTADYLRQILAVISNTTIPSVRPYSSRPSLPDNTVSLINGLWFSSLTLSLSSAFIGIMAKQWLREYLRDAGQSQKTNLAVRQVKYQGLTRWYVGAIIAMMPLLLQGALFLFLVGIVYLLWHIQPVVAAVISVFGIFIVSFFVATTVLPAAQFILEQTGHLHLHTTCQFPYKSAQSWLFLRMTLIVINFVAWLYHTLLKGFQYGKVFVAPFPTYPSWSQLDLDWTDRRDRSAYWSEEPTSIGLCLGFMELNFEHPLLRGWIWNCLWDMRKNPVNAKYVLQCARRTPKVKANFPSIHDDLAYRVLPHIHPRVVPEATTELIAYMLLPSNSQTSVEHIIRMHNTLLHSGVDEIPLPIYNALRTTLHDVRSGSSSPDIRMQLFHVAQNMLKKSQHTEDDCAPPLEMVTAIVTHLSHGEVKDAYGFSARELSLDISTDIIDWLERHPDPSSNWEDYKSRVSWSAHTVVLLARRLASFKQLDTAFATAWHPRLPAIYAFAKLVNDKARSIPADTLPTWTPEKYDMEEFARVKVSLEAACAAPGSESDGELPRGSNIPPPRPPIPRRRRVPSIASMKESRKRSIKRSGLRQQDAHKDEEESAELMPVTDFALPDDADHQPTTAASDGSLGSGLAEGPGPSIMSIVEQDEPTLEVRTPLQMRGSDVEGETEMDLADGPMDELGTYPPV